jgi:hypothetical protein
MSHPNPFKWRHFEAEISAMPRSWTNAVGRI